MAKKLFLREYKEINIELKLEPPSLGSEPTS
jgi:hypothetical protein